MSAARFLPSLQRKPAAWERYSYSRKLRWRCQHPDPALDYGVWADKIRARELVRGKLPAARLYAVARRANEIDASALPETFVMKASHGWDMSLLVKDGIVKGRNRSEAGAGRRADTAYLRQVAREWLESGAEVDRQRRERHYLFVQPGILFEELIEPVDHELQLFLFEGRPRITMVFYRAFWHEGSTHRLYDANWNLLEPGHEEAGARYERLAPPTPPPPRALLDLLEDLCRPIDHVRADLYVTRGTYVFGEFTFTHNAGQPGNLGKYDAELGSHWRR